MNFRTIAFLNKNRCFPPAQTNNCICTLRRSALYRPVLTLLQGQGNTPLITTTQIYHFFSIIKGSNAKKLNQIRKTSAGPHTCIGVHSPSYPYGTIIAVLPCQCDNIHPKYCLCSHFRHFFVKIRKFRISKFTFFTINIILKNSKWQYLMFSIINQSPVEFLDTKKVYFCGKTFRSFLRKYFWKKNPQKSGCGHGWLWKCPVVEMALRKSCRGSDRLRKWLLTFVCSDSSWNITKYGKTFLFGVGI